MYQLLSSYMQPRILAKATPITIIVLAVLIVFQNPIVQAQSVIGEVIVENNYAVDLRIVVDGDSYIIPSGESMVFPLGSTFCVSEEVVATSETSRLAFKGWIVDGSIKGSGPCLEMENSGIITPYYVMEYLVVVSSEPEGVYSLSFWVEAGSLLSLEVPEVLEKGNLKFVLSSIDPSLPAVRSSGIVYLDVPVSEFTTITLRYVEYVRVEILREFYGLGNLYEWMVRGEPGFVFLDDNIQVGERERLVLKDVYAVGGVARILTGGIVEVLPDSPGTVVIPVYQREFLVRIDYGDYTTETWVVAGSELTLTADQIIQTGSSGTRLSFVGWSVNGERFSTSPTVVLRVDAPVDVKAEYRLEYRVLLESPIGQRESWVPAGGSTILISPPRLPGLLTVEVLDYYFVEGSQMKPRGGGVLILESVNNPMQVVAVYRTAINWGNLAILTGVLLGILVLYVAYDFIVSRRLEQRIEEVGEPPPEKAQ